MIVRMAVPSTPATAAATPKYLFHKRLARACHTCRRYDLGKTRASCVYV
jgi:hypothetical protein